MRIAETPVTHFDPVKREMDELEKRIEEEAGPVKTYQAIEWFLPGKGTWPETPAINVTKRHVYCNRALRNKWLGVERVKVGWDKLANAIVIQPAGRNEERQSYKYSVATGRFGGPTLCQRLAEYGFGLGSYEVEIDGKRVLIKPRKQVKS